MQHRVLVVGDDPALVRELRSEGQSAPSDWHFHCVPTGTEALAALGQGAHTAVVANWKLPGVVSGSALLDEVLRQYPRCLRFVRTAMADSSGTAKSVGTAHRLLLEPVDIQTLKQAVADALAVSAWLPSDRVSSVLQTLQRVPGPPQLYFELVELLESPTASLQAISDCISRDPALVAKLLQMANSAVFGLRLRVNHPAEALSFLGLETTRVLVLLAHTFSYFNDLGPEFSVAALWQHSFAAARWAQAISEGESANPELVSQAFTAGLLHDFGKLVLAANRPGQFQRAVERAFQEGMELWQSEANVFGTDHAEVGACLLSIWGLPIPIIEAVGLHHRPGLLEAPDFRPLTAVHVANVLAQSTDSTHAQPALPSLDMEYIVQAGCAERVGDWMAVGDPRT